MSGKISQYLSHNIKHLVSCDPIYRSETSSICNWTEMKKKPTIFHWLLDVNRQRKSPQTHLLLLRLMTLSFCMSPISSGKDSNLLECRNSTVAFFQFPIWKNPETQNREPWANKARRVAREQTVTSHCVTCISKHTSLTVHTHLGGKLNKEVVISGKSADAGALADGGGQGFDLIETAVEFIQNSQPDAAKSRTGALIKWLYYIYTVQRRVKSFKGRIF